MIHMRMDTASSVQLIGGLSYGQFTITIYREKMRMFRMAMLARLHRGYDFGINYVCVDEPDYAEVEAALRASQFGPPPKPAIRSSTAPGVKRSGH
jgi:hypothetical protein